MHFNAHYVDIHAHIYLLGLDKHIYKGCQLVRDYKPKLLVLLLLFTFNLDSLSTRLIL